MSTIALARKYPAIEGAPVLREVDPRIFRLRYFQRCMACGFCNDQCCNVGVDIDAANAERLLAQGPAFEAHIGVPRAQWFTDVAIADPEFPSGFHRRTQTREGHCVFRAPAGRGCRIHAWCIDNDLDYRVLKPMVSILFPLTFEAGVLLPSTEISDGSLVCANEGETLYDGVKEELRYFFTDALVEELDDLRARCAASVE